jgi:hypothetical protein
LFLLYKIIGLVEKSQKEGKKRKKERKKEEVKK